MTAALDEYSINNSADNLIFRSDLFATPKACRSVPIGIAVCIVIFPGFQNGIDEKSELLVCWLLRGASLPGNRTILAVLGYKIFIRSGNETMQKTPFLLERHHRQVD